MKKYDDAVLKYYRENREEIIAQFRKDMDDDCLPEDDKNLEEWYMDTLLFMANNRMLEDIGGSG